MADAAPTRRGSESKRARHPGRAASAGRSARSVAYVYLLVSVPYILFSDTLVEALVAAENQGEVHTIKGLSFVALSALLIYSVARSVVSRAERAALLDGLITPTSPTSEAPGLAAVIERACGSLADLGLDVSVAVFRHPAAPTERVPALDESALEPLAVRGFPPHKTDDLARVARQARDARSHEAVVPPCFAKSLPDVDAPLTLVVCCRELSGEELAELTRRMGALLSLHRARQVAQDAAARALELNEQLDEAQRIALLGSWRLDLATRKVQWTDQVNRIFGVEEGDGPYEGYLSHVHPDDRDRVIAAHQKSRADHSPIDHTYRIIRPDGEVRWVRGQGVVVTDDEGEPVRLAGTVQDVTEQRLAEEREVAANRRIQALARHLTTAREEERRALSRDVHDQLGQHLAALRLMLARLKAPADEEQRALFAEVDHIVEELSDQIRRLARSLRPPVVDKQGLAPALRERLAQLAARSGLRWSLEATPETIEMPPDDAVHVYLACQEALVNVARHADASSVNVVLRADAGLLTVAIEDDGVGLARDVEEGIGLTSIRERAELLEGRMTVTSGDGRGGTRVQLELPLPRRADAPRRHHKEADHEAGPLRG